VTSGSTSDDVSCAIRSCSAVGWKHQKMTHSTVLQKNAGQILPHFLKQGCSKSCMYYVLCVVIAAKWLTSPLHNKHGSHRYGCVKVY